MSVDLRTIEPMPAEELALVHEEVARREQKYGAKTISVTAMHHADNCMRAGALYFAFGGGTSSHELTRGSIFHTFAEEATNYLLEEGQTMMPEEVAKDRMEDLLDRSEHVPVREQEALRICAWHWANATVIDPQTFVGAEIPVSLELGDWRIRGRIDRADVIERTLMIRDYKTSLHVPNQEDFETDARVQLYALLAMQGTVEGQDTPLGLGMNSVWVVWEHPRRPTDDGFMSPRSVEFTQAQLFDIRQSFERDLARFDEALEDGSFDAKAGTWCGSCPAASHCPLPARYREVKPTEQIITIESDEQATELMEELLILDRRRKSITGSLRERVKQTGEPVLYGDQAFDSRFEQSRSTDWAKAQAAMQRAAEYGEQFDPEDYIKIRPATKYVLRKQTAEERDA